MNDNKFEQLDDEISLLELFNTIKPYMLHIFLITLISGLLGFLYTKLLVDPVYQADATLIVNNRRDETSNAITNDEINSAKNLASVYNIIIKSDAVMLPVVENTRSELKPQELAKKVSVSSVDNTQVIRISVKDTDPNIARDYANEIINVSPAIIVDMVEAGSVKVVSLPQVPTSPVSPSVSRNAVIAAALGFIASAGFILVKQLMDRRVKNIDELEALLDMPVLGVIPNVESVRRGK